jgi:cyclopropane fatty-acyl-phospholipid synthase-like methyltransferase
MLKRLFYTLSYLRNPPWDTGISPPELMAFIQDHEPGRALDLGCGTGTNAITLAQHGWQVVGVDFVGKAIRSASNKARRAGVKIDFCVGDVSRLDGIHGPFDLILDIGCFHSLSASAKEDYIHNLKHLLSDNGTFLIFGFVNQEQQSQSGITTKDLSRFETNLTLISRQDGTERGIRRSAWLEFQK